MDKIRAASFENSHTRQALRYQLHSARPPLAVKGMTHQTGQYILLKGQFWLGLRRRG